MKLKQDVWNLMMNRVLTIPGVRVNRDKFLIKELRKHFTDEAVLEALETSPVDTLGLVRINEFADDCIRKHTMCVTSIAAITGIPGGIAVAATVPADMIQ